MSRPAKWYGTAKRSDAHPESMYFQCIAMRESMTEAEPGCSTGWHIGEKFATQCAEARAARNNALEEAAYQAARAVPV